MKLLSFVALLLLATFATAQNSDSNQTNQTTCGDYIQYFCSIRSDCPEPSQSSTPIINVNGNSIDLRDFNAVSFGSFVARTGDVQGRVACAKDFAAGNGFSIGDQLEAQGSNVSSNSYPYALIVGGNAVWGSGRMYSEGVFVGGNSRGDVFRQMPGLESCSGRDNCLSDEFSNARSYFVQVSEYFASQQENTEYSIEFSTLSITCNSSSDLYVLNIEGKDLRDITSYQVSSSCNISALWLFNVMGRDSVIFRGDFFRQVAISVLWNIIGDRTVNVFTQVRGNILAPQSTFTQPGGVVDGNVIAKEMLLVLQINTPRCIPIGGEGAPVPVPIPSLPPSSNETQQQGEICPFWERNCTGYHFTLNDSQISFKNYHVISFGNFYANTGDVEGRLAVRNDLILGCGYSIGFQLNTGGENATEVPEEYSLIVGNNARWCSGALFPDGSGSPFTGNREEMFVGGQLTAPAYLQLRKSSASCSNCLASAFTSARACYTDISNSYANLNSNVNVTMEFSNLNLTCQSANESQYIVVISGEQLSQATSWQVSNCNNSAFFVINVIGNGTVTFTGGSLPIAPSNVLYNILGCGRIINVVTGVNGAILAPYNLLNQTGGVIIGKVVIGDVLFALQINLVRCPLNMQENTTLPVNQTNQSSSNNTGASTMVTTGAGEQTGAGGIIGSTTGSLNETMAQIPAAQQNITLGGLEQECPILVLVDNNNNSNNTNTETQNTNTTQETEQIPSRAWGTEANIVHNSAIRMESVFGIAFIASLFF